ncbi:hypothetical protein FPOAC2_04398 [Fusarium poae]|jgi:pimeloyl-ACP methyl ester carboxylesterase|uniref:AB hydrolase-1 domain-containing protein n=1 Tax=Fusarium poae TaxID=36050 RepID=A0A1B8ASM8_FUSPO|nr:hypothetical protein FPOAC1_004315 [Fusarium poae]KAG8671078.1 hypothetical protein FPOAC1_004315 [Fusarium poae]OBS23354.1 hypothetical protein FPOA_03903 [Fusarium poae]
MKDPEDRIATLADGRKVSYAIYGTENPDAPTTFYFHGWPGSHHEGYLTHSAALKHGLRVIATTRPGYSDSTFQENRSILDYPKDILEIANLLSVQRFTVLGVSGGGPYAIACLKEIPRDRLVGIGTLAGCMPLSFSTEGMLGLARFMFNVAPYATAPLGWLIDKIMGTVARDTEHPEKLEEMADKEAEAKAPSDAEAWKNHPDLRRVILRSNREAMKQGGYPMAWDARLYGSDWGFKLEDLKVGKGQMILWHGDQDQNVPIRVSYKAAEVIPNAELRVMKGDSHMSLMVKTEEPLVAMKEMLER